MAAGYACGLNKVILVTVVLVEMNHNRYSNNIQYRMMLVAQAWPNHGAAFFTHHKEGDQRGREAPWFIFDLKRRNEEKNPEQLGATGLSFSSWELNRVNIVTVL